MTAIDQATFDRLFDGVTRSAFRWESLQRFNAPDEAEDLRRFLAGEPTTVYTPANDPWLAHIAATAAAGVTWQRTRLVRLPMEPYTRWEIEFFRRSSAPAGEDVRVVLFDEHPAELSGFIGRDFWLLDDTTAVLLDYDKSGRLAGMEQTQQPRQLQWCRDTRDQVLTYSTPLAEFLEREAARA